MAGKSARRISSRVPISPPARASAEPIAPKDLPMPASQHQTPKSDIEISQNAKIIPIMKIARERLGIEAENLDPYGHYKAKLSMDFVKSLKNRPNGKLILVSAITPTPAGQRQTNTIVS